MMIMESGPTPCYPNGYGVSEQQIYSSSSSSLDADSSSSTTNPTSFLYNLSVLKDKVHQVQSLATIFFSPDHPESTAIAIPTMGTLIQEIIVTASTMMFSCQQMSLGSPPTNSGGPAVVEEAPPLSSFFSNDHDTADDHWFNIVGYDNHATDRMTAVGNCTEGVCEKVSPTKTETNEEQQGPSLSSYDIVELEAADILAKYTHYCHVCGKGFKRDANLRMHMRAHGDEYKSSAALSNPLKNGGGGGGEARVPRKYSCPQEGCRWNKKHAKFQPLKSMICVKNHYKRSHCPKMYVCKRCNRKQFSVLSDLRTHEKHCGDLKWQCSCGTTFSRKDKLMGHVALFIGHKPATKMVNGGAQNTGLVQVDDAR